MHLGFVRAKRATIMYTTVVENQAKKSHFRAKRAKRNDVPCDFRRENSNSWAFLKVFFIHFEGTAKKSPMKHE